MAPSSDHLLFEAHPPMMTLRGKHRGNGQQVKHPDVHHTADVAAAERDDGEGRIGGRKHHEGREFKPESAGISRNDIFFLDEL